MHLQPSSGTTIGAHNPIAFCICLKIVQHTEPNLVEDTAIIDSPTLILLCNNKTPQLSHVRKNLS